MSHPVLSSDSTQTLLNIAETATYYSPSGSIIGTMTIQETAAPNSDLSFVNVYGLGIWTPISGARTPVQLGLYCGLGTSSTAQCAGGIAQNFPLLNLAIGAVTP